MLFLGKTLFNMDDKSKYIQYFIFKSEEEFEFPIQKTLMEDGWFCCLRVGCITVEFNYKTYTITANEREMIYFFVNEGMFFNIISGSPDFQLDVISINHTCLTLAYPYLNSDTNVQISYSVLLCSNQMDENIRDLFINIFNQLELVSKNCNELLDYEKMVTGLIVYALIVYCNAISKWRKAQGLNIADKLIDSQVQSYQIMNNLSLIMDEPDSLQHRDVQYFAKRLNISVRYFFNVCKQETGMTPKEFINDIIISELKHILLTTNLSLQQITLKYDFPDQSAFTQFFRRNTGMTPSEFRHQHK